MRELRTALAVLVGIVLATGCADAPPPADPPPRPNVVLLVVDTLRADRLPFYGAPRDTAPFLTELASDSIVFDNAWAASSWTLPSTVSFLTSLHPFQHGVVGLEGLELEEGDEPVPVNCIPSGVETLAELLSANGYRTFGVVSNLLVGPEVGFDRGFDRFVQLDDEPADAVNAQLVLWQDEIASSEPYFLYVHYIDPHDVYHAREPWFSEYWSAQDRSPLEGGGEGAGWPSTEPPGRDDTGYLDWILTRLDPGPEGFDGLAASDLSAAQREELLTWIRTAYDSEIASVDRHVREVFERLDLDDAVFLFLADHGEELYEHGALTHGLNLHVETTKVPLFLRLPGSREGSHVEAPVSTLDVVPTLRALLGLPGSDQDEGRDLLADSPAERTLFSELDAKADSSLDRLQLSVQHDRHRLLVNGEGDLELYDLVADPGEREDLSARLPSVVEDLRSRLDRLRSEAAVPEHATCLPTPADEQMLERLRAIGYLGDEASR